MNTDMFLKEDFEFKKLGKFDLILNFPRAISHNVTIQFTSQVDHEIVPHDAPATFSFADLVVVVDELGRVAAWLLRPTSTWSCPYLPRSRWQLAGTKRY